MATTRITATERLVRGLAEGFVYQGEPSRQRQGAPRGEPSADLPPTAFIDFLQNHDQVGNRALRRAADDACRRRPRSRPARRCCCSARMCRCCSWARNGVLPHRSPISAISTASSARRSAPGGRREFAAFHDHDVEVPDPLAESTFSRSQLQWSDLDDPHHRRLAGTDPGRCWHCDRALSRPGWPGAACAWKRPKCWASAGSGCPGGWPTAAC